MLFNQKVLKYLMKAAYKGIGLTVGIDDVMLCPGDGALTRSYVISGGAGWTVNIKEDFVPKEIKAVIMECAGELPEEEGEFFTAYAKNPTNYALAESYETSALASIEEPPYPFEVSSLSIGDRRIMIVEMHKVLLANIFLDLLRGEPDRERQEEGLKGRCYLKSRFYFWNNTCSLRVYESGLNETEAAILKNLEDVDILGRNLIKSEEE